MTTDTAALQERIARALDPWIWTDEDDDPNTFRRLARRSSRLAERPASLARAAAVLPLIRAAQADAWDQGQDDLTLYYQSEGLAGSEGRNPYRDA